MPAARNRGERHDLPFDRKCAAASCPRQRRAAQPSPAAPPATRGSPGRRPGRRGEWWGGRGEAGGCERNPERLSVRPTRLSEYLVNSGAFIRLQAGPTEGDRRNRGRKMSSPSPSPWHPRRTGRADLHREVTSGPVAPAATSGPPSRRKTAGLAAYAICGQRTSGVCRPDGMACPSARCERRCRSRRRLRSRLSVPRSRVCRRSRSAE